MKIGVGLPNTFMLRADRQLMLQWIPTLKQLDLLAEAAELARPPVEIG